VRGGLIAAPVSPAPLAGMERLNAADRPPVAVALSGGGDSLALLHLAKTWADGAGRSLIALTVDHGLQPRSAPWSRLAAERAGRLGVPHRTLAWLGEKPATGLPAAARSARHALLADAARSAGARVILVAHTADDLMEAELMRRMGASAPSPRLWSPSPAWPQGRGVFLLRPLLTHRRADLRALLEGLGETWIEDPANDDPRYFRTLARRRLGDCPTIPPPPSVLSPPSGWEAVEEGRGGELALPRDTLNVCPTDRRRLIGVLALCAAGTIRPPAATSLDRIATRISGGGFSASLAGARVEANGERVMFCREAGERARGGLQSADLALGETIFDGRYLLSARQSGYRVSPLSGLVARLPPAERDRLRAIWPTVRGALPAVVAPSGAVSCPVLAPNHAVLAKPLGLARLHAALGVIADESGAIGGELSLSGSRRRCGA
jgi:tRNA(Ile)-lysidine synthase